MVGGGTGSGGVIAPAERIIWSADVADEATLMRILDDLPELRVIKIDRYFVEGRDFGVFDRLRERGLMVFDDAKIVEVPSKGESLAEDRHLPHRPWMLNCMAGIESSDILDDPDPEKIDGLKRFADACHKVGTKACAVTVLTSKKEEVVRREFNGRSSIEQVLYYVELLLNCGFTDLVCSPQEVAAIRAESRFDVLETNSPGVRLAGSDTQDQARVDTPENLIVSGGTRMVVGRPLTNNPVANWPIWLDAVTAACYKEPA